MDSVGNIFLGYANKILSKKLLADLLFIAYKLKGVKIEKVIYHTQFHAWEYIIEGISYFSSGPGWAYTNAYLNEQIRKLSCFVYFPKSGDVVLDIGAGVGEETIIFSQVVGNTGKVYAIEAHPKTFSALSMMVNNNNLSNVSLAQIALSDKPGIVQLGDEENSLANSIVFKLSKAIEVSSITLDQFVIDNQISTIDFLKMNVEGAEQYIIKGMTQSIVKVKNIAISCHDFLATENNHENFRTKEKVKSFLIQNNFRIVSQRNQQAMIEDYIYGVREVD